MSRFASAPAIQRYFGTEGAASLSKQVGRVGLPREGDVPEAGQVPSGVVISSAKRGIAVLLCAW
jgi:hypothetical protein